MVLASSLKRGLGLIRFLARRFFSLIVTLLGVTILIFLLINFIPGDPCTLMYGERATESSLRDCRATWGLDKPLYVQYGLFMNRLLHGDLGKSFRTQAWIIDEIKIFFPATVELSFMAMIIASMIGMVAGVISATKQYSIFDYSTMIMAITGISMPIFWLGLILIIIFSVQFGIVPISGRMDPTIDLQQITHFYIIDSILSKNWVALKDSLWHLILPSFTLSTIPMALIARITRSSMLEVLRQDYIRTAKAKGLSDLIVYYKHALRNALIPIVTVIGLSFGFLMGGAVLTEFIFAWPGIGSWILAAVYTRDYYAVQAGVLLVAFIFVLVNTLVDVLYVWINPRIRVS
jgi:peptide/nickel transport system permease protein